MSYTNKEEYDVLHGVRVRGLTKPENLSSEIGLDSKTVQQVLDDAVARERAKSRSGGRVEGYMLTAKGRDRHTELRGELSTEQELMGLAAAYEDFLTPNRKFKALTTKWQTEADGDVSVVLPELLTLHDTVATVLSTASDSIPRLKSYNARFDTALAAFRGGETSALARPMSGSYHDVWMELHEDLLLSLGRERTDDDE